MNKESQQGVLIVCAGTDGAGKQTQTRLMRDRLRKEGFAVEEASFPMYGTPGAQGIKEYLAGEYGDAKAVHPKLASRLFAEDRFMNAPNTVTKWLSEGKIIICDRYVSGNKGHQLGKITDHQERKEFLQWLDQLEYGMFGIPKEHINILFYMPPIVSKRLAQQRRQESAEKADIHEGNEQHLRDAADAYLWIAKEEGWPIIHCLINPELSEEHMRSEPLDSIIRSRDDIHEEFYNIVRKLIDF